MTTATIRINETINSKELRHMIDENAIERVSLRFGIIGAGQKGNKDADIFAGYKFSSGKQCYPTLAFNLASQDMDRLTNIPKEDRITFPDTHGAARNPQVVMQTLNPKTEKGKERRRHFLESMQRKFMDSSTNQPVVDHFILSIGSGGGVGTGFGMFAIQLMAEAKFPRPVTMFISLPEENKVEVANAMVLMGQLDKFMKWEDEQIQTGKRKRRQLANIIFVDNEKLKDTFERKVNDRYNDLTNERSWKEESNHVIASILHEMNVIPANYTSDENFDPADFQRFMQAHPGVITIGKFRLEENAHTLEKFTQSMKSSLDRGFFSCDHVFTSAKEYGFIALRHTDNSFFKSVKTQNARDNIVQELKEIPGMFGKNGDPIWNQNYSVVYSMFCGMKLPKRIHEMQEYLEKIKEMEQEYARNQVEETVNFAKAWEIAKEETNFSVADDYGSGFTTEEKGNSFFDFEDVPTEEDEGTSFNLFGSDNENPFA